MTEKASPEFRSYAGYVADRVGPNSGLSVPGHTVVHSSELGGSVNLGAHSNAVQILKDAVLSLIPSRYNWLL
jgi:hypothetical protein